VSRRSVKEGVLCEPNRRESKEIGKGRAHTCRVPCGIYGELNRGDIIWEE